MKGPQTERAIDVCRSTAELEALEAEWRALEARASSLQLFQTYDWVERWWHHLGSSGGDQLRIFTVRREGRLILLWPGVLCRRGPWRILRSTGGLMSCYDDVLASQETQDPGGLADLLESMRREPGVDVLEFHAVHQDSLLATLDLPPAVSTTTAPFVDCTTSQDFDAYLASRPKRMRKNQRRTWRMLESEGRLDSRVDDRDISPSDAISRALELKQAWIEARGLPAKTLFRTEGQRFLIDVSERFAAKESRIRLCVSSLRLDEEIISLGIGLRLGTRHYEYLGAYDPRYDAHGAGRARMERTIQDCFDRGIEAYDMLTPSTTFKALWTEDAPTVSQHLIPRTAAGRAYSVYVTRVRPTLKAIYLALPAPLRSRVGFGPSRSA